MSTTTGPRIFPVALEIHLAEDLTPEEQDEARTHAADADALGIDDYVAEGMADAPFPEVVAHLLMFDPRWLFTRRWLAGWVAEAGA